MIKKNFKIREAKIGKHSLHAKSNNLHLKNDKIPLKTNLLRKCDTSMDCSFYYKLILCTL